MITQIIRHTQFLIYFYNLLKWLVVISGQILSHDPTMVPPISYNFFRQWQCATSTGCEKVCEIGCVPKIILGLIPIPHDYNNKFMYGAPIKVKSL